MLGLPTMPVGDIASKREAGAPCARPRRHRDRQGIVGQQNEPRSGWLDRVRRVVLVLQDIDIHGYSELSELTYVWLTERYGRELSLFNIYFEADLCSKFLRSERVPEFAHPWHEQGKNIG